MAAGVYSLKLVGRDGIGNEWNNVLHYSVVGADAVSPIQTAFRLRAAWTTAVQATFLGCLAEDIVLRYIASRRELGGATHLYTVPNPNSGLRPGSSASLVMGPQISFFSDSSTKSVGKQFLPGISLQDVQDGEASATLISAVSDYLDALLPQLTLAPGTDTAVLTIFNRSGPTSYDVVVAEQRPKMGIQSRRILSVR